jgi:hypothetical protein
LAVEDDLHGSNIGGAVERNIADCRGESVESIPGPFVARADHIMRSDRADEVSGAGAKDAMVWEEEHVRMKIASLQQRSLGAVLDVARE